MILATAVLIAQVGFPLFTDFPPEEFAKRRAAVFDAIGKNAIAVVQGAPTPVGSTRVRLEDLTVITEKGRDVLSDFVPRDMASIEKIMKEEGLLERYLRAD